MKKWLVAVTAVVVLIGGFAIWLHSGVDRQEGEAPPRIGAEPANEVERGRELVTLADCKACHTRRGGAAFAGDRPIPTPFGTFYSPNITPDTETGIGNWTEENFWRALHNGRGPDGKAFYPAFPYTNYTRVSRRGCERDVRLSGRRSVAGARDHARARARISLWESAAAACVAKAVFPAWRAHDRSRKARNGDRGAYLVQALGHCDACHEARNSFGAPVSQNSFSGGRVFGWYAPALDTPLRSGLQDWARRTSSRCCRQAAPRM